MRMSILSKLENMVEATSPLFLSMNRGIRIKRLGMSCIILKGEGADSPEKFTYNLTHCLNTPLCAEYTVRKASGGISYGIMR